jgi:hypothetical protein
MRALMVGIIAVPILDLLLKSILGRALGSAAIRLGSFGAVRIVAARIWLDRLGWHVRPILLWVAWLLIASALVTASAPLRSSRLFVGLILGGSLSNMLESSWRGGVRDYVCLRFWPAFNLADVALTAGAIGLGIDILFMVQRTTWP